jgi:hypothetical protein
MKEWPLIVLDSLANVCVHGYNITKYWGWSNAQDIQATFTQQARRHVPNCFRLIPFYYYYLILPVKHSNLQNPVCYFSMISLSFYSVNPKGKWDQRTLNTDFIKFNFIQWMTWLTFDVYFIVIIFNLSALSNSRDSSVNVVIRLRDGRWRNRFNSLYFQRDFFYRTSRPALGPTRSPL